ncbi:MAG: glycerol-3-phosphate 1-O-acyltransferase PlsY [Nitrospirae bacterium]|nr:glycerol-3-phosphate 1-O-acyltransferase PlsY [Nitrospirota bacterium]MCL5977392.1 glycerol-3-phosphate 1-O-acyltransferase PlsY [Nitrospirota bacterium]
MIFALIIASFIIGSIPTGLLIAKTKGIDLRKIGSGNIGATNVMRAVGKEAALLTLLGDIGKGIIPIVIVRLVSPGFLYEAAAGLSAIMGHNFSIFLKFKGGKGVATSLGVLAAFSPHVGLFTAMLWLMTAKWTRYSSLSALVAFGLLPFSFYLIDYSRQNIIFGAIIAFLIFIRHAANIKRLIQGTESKIGQKANGHKRDQR